ncbi:TCR gamma alternate reading frame protein isoform X2 [Rhinatrema bivittatum]|nr:TCR gamma alternate reading frame protein isoform X2 [Rhinatrema bivittatum]
MLPPSPAELEKTGKGTFLCVLTGFFPDVIKVEWIEAGKESQSLQDAVIGESSEDERGSFSISSWLTVRKEHLGKRYMCQYWHEGNSQNKEVIKLREPETGNVIEPTEDEIQDCPDNSTNVAEGIGTGMALNLNHNVAHITYILLLLKSSFYTLVVFFFLCKRKAPPAPDQVPSS